MEPQTCKTVLLSDEPAATDWFGSHEKLAVALADLISNESGGRAIALTGSWGSGKSSTVKFLSDKLDKQTRVFIFNAWSHQGDPLRRTFLEQLIDFLANEGWLSSASEWSKKKDKLAGRQTTQNTISTPLLSPYGKLLGISLLLTPLGLAMFSRWGVEKVPEWVPKWGAVFASAPLLCLLLVLIAYWVSWVLRKAGLTSKVKWIDRFIGWSKERLDIFAVLLNKSTTETESETIESGQPTSVEFQQYFNDLMNDALCGNTNKLVIVIDNLDRIDPEDGLALWSTMTTFFDFGTTMNCAWRTSLWLIVPFDPAALSRLWPQSFQRDSDEQKDGEDKSKPSKLKSEDLARVFVDKTFATAFHVPPPVRSDWRTYLVDQLTKALPDHADRGEDEFHWVYRIYQLGGLSQNRSPTPREIKIFVNKLGAIHRQRQDEIKLPLQALYVVLSNKTWDLEDKLRTATDDKLLGSIPIGYVGSEWLTALAAIHFNAPFEKALQLLLGTKTEAALLSGDPEKLKEFEKISGITQVIEDVIGDNWTEWSTSDTSSLALAARALRNLGFGEDPSLNSGWQMLCDGTETVKVWANLNPEIGEGIVEILKHRTHEDLARKVVASLGKSPSTGEKDSTQEPTTTELWLLGVSKVLSAVQAEFPDALQNFSVPGDAATYIAVMSKLEAHAELNDIGEFFAPSAALKDVVDGLVKISNEEKFTEETSGAILSILRVKKDWPWSKLSEQLKIRLDATNTPNITEVKASIRTLLHLERSLPAANKVIATLAAEGHLAHQLYQCSLAKDQEAVALCMLPIIENTPDGELTGSPANAANGISLYTEFIANPASNATLLSEVANLTSEFAKIETIFDLAEATETQAVAHAILKELASGPKATERLEPAAIIKHYKVLTTACEPEAFNNLVKGSIDRSSLIDELTARGFQAGLSELYLSALHSAENDSRLLAFLEKGLKSIDKETWSSELQSEGKALTLVIDLRRAGRTLDLGIPFQDALHLHAKDLLEGKAKIKHLREHWNLLPGALSATFQEAFLQRISELLYSGTLTEPILAVYGDQLLNGDVLNENAERLVLNAFADFLSRGNISELNWIARAFRASPDLLSKVKASTKKDFAGHVSQAYEENQENEGLRQAIEEITSVAKVKLPRLHEKKDEKKGKDNKEEGAKEDE